MSKQLRAADAVNANGLAFDRNEVGKFEAIADEVWDPAGPMRPLHRLNPVRTRYILDQANRAIGSGGASSLRPLDGVRLVDIGCGAGLLAEPMARLGADVTGVDPSPRSIGAARAHAEASGLTIDYRQSTVDELASEGASFDLVLAMEVIEHTLDPDVFVAGLAEITRPGGLLVMSTLNRTVKSYLLGILAAEYALGWLPRGTHDWRRFLPPATLARLLRRRGLRVLDTTGIVFRPTHGDFAISRDCSVNYMLSASRD